MSNVITVYAFEPDVGVVRSSAGPVLVGEQRQEDIRGAQASQPYRKSKLQVH